MVDKKNGNEKNSNKLPDWVKKAKATILNFLKQAPHFIWQRLKESLLFAVLKACFLIFLLVYIAFAIKPKQAHIIANLSELGKETSLLAKSVVLDDLDCDGISFMSTTAVYIDLEHVEVEEVTADINNDSSMLVIYPTDIDLSYFLVEGNINSANLTDVFLNGFYNFSYKESKCNFVGALNLSVYSGRAVFIADDGRIVAEPDIRQYTIIKEDYSAEKIIDPSSDVEQPGVIWFRNAFSPNEYYWSGDHLVYKHHGKRTINSYMKIRSGELHASGIKHLETKATGKLGLSYTLTPQEYSMYKQELILNNNTINEDLDLDYYVKHNAGDDYYESEGIIYGFVTEGELSKMSLFPSFKTWFYSNVYMTPTAIIAIVLTAVGIFIKNNK